jgi:hypothetical protein
MLRYNIDIVQNEDVVLYLNIAFLIQVCNAKQYPFDNLWTQYPIAK